MNRRNFIQTSAIAMASGMTARARTIASTLLCWLAWPRPRSHHAATPSFRRRALPPCAISIRRRSSAPCNSRKSHRHQAAEDLPGHSQAARRQRCRRCLDRDVQPLARAGDHLGLPGGQRCLRGKAREPRNLGRPQDGGGGAQVQPHGAGGHAEPHHAAQDQGDAVAA